jgi:hypothetical protein
MGSVYGTAGKTQQNYGNLANSSYNAAQQDISDYGSAVGKFNANNPYVQGGSVETAQNQQASDTAAGLAESAGQSLQGAAVRTGQNAGGAIAATEDMQEKAQRALTGEEAGNTIARAGANTGYEQAGLGGLATKQSMQDAMAAQESGASQAALNTQQQAAQMPSFMDTLGTSFATQTGKGLSTMLV